jgi:glutamate-1-semialdehyde 2,1-aminomutase
MKEQSGFSVIRNLGNHLCNLFNNAAKEVGITDLIMAKPKFAGAMFDLEFSPEIISNIKWRKKLPCFLANSGILLLQGHPSFICLDHRLLDFDDLYRKLINGLQSWIDSN